MPDTKEKILIRIDKLFYRQGFSNTGIDQLTKDVGITKPSLYHHFQSKNALGFAYLEEKAKSLFSMLDSLLAESKSYTMYMNRWANTLLVLAKRNEFYGCPFTAFASELKPEERTEFEPKLREIERNWISFQEKAYLQFHPEAKDAKEIAKKILMVHTGCVMLYRASLDLKYMKQLKKEFNEIAL